MAGEPPASDGTGQADARVKRTLRRLLIELFWLRADHAALREMTGLDHCGYDFFLVSQRSLHGDRLLRLVRVLDEDREASAFWYLHRCMPACVEAALTSGTATIGEIQDLSGRLKIVRDRSFIHIDKRAVFDPKALYKEAAITGEMIVRIVDGLWSALHRLHVEIVGQPLKMPAEYDGRDVPMIHAAYLAARGTGKSKV